VGVKGLTLRDSRTSTYTDSLTDRDSQWQTVGQAPAQHLRETGDDLSIAVEIVIEFKQRSGNELVITRHGKHCCSNIYTRSHTYCMHGDTISLTVVTVWEEKSRIFKEFQQSVATLHAGLSSLVLRLQYSCLGGRLYRLELKPRIWPWFFAIPYVFHFFGCQREFTSVLLICDWWLVLWIQTQGTVSAMVIW